MPEPYNNLAVIYAAQGHFDKAREALELAIKTHPSYSVAHENLGDLYAKLASMAYDKALELDRANTVTKTKLALIRDLFAAPTQTNAAPAPDVTESAPADITPTAPQVTDTTPSKPARIARSAPVTGQASAKIVAPASPADVNTTVQHWAAAWSRQDVDGYLGHYSAEFKPTNGMELDQWKALRRTRIETPKTIQIKLTKLQIKVDGDIATASFKQHYRSGRLNEWMRKTLQLRREAGTWLIVDER